MEGGGLLHRRRAANSWPVSPDNATAVGRSPSEPVGARTQDRAGGDAPASVSARPLPLPYSHVPPLTFRSPHWLLAVQWPSGSASPQLGLGCPLSSSRLASVWVSGDGRALRVAEAEGTAGLTRAQRDNVSSSGSWAAPAGGESRQEGRSRCRASRSLLALTGEGHGLRPSPRSGGGDSGQSSGASALDLFRVAFP